MTLPFASLCVFCLFKLRLPFSEQFYVHSETDSRRGGPPCAPDTHRPSLCPHVTGGAFVVADELTGTHHRPRVRGRHQGGSRRGAFCGLGQTWSGAFPRSRGHTERPPCPKPASSTCLPPGPVTPDTRRSVPTVEPFPGRRTVRSFSQSRAFRVHPHLFGAE